MTEESRGRFQKAKLRRFTAGFCVRVYLAGIGLIGCCRLGVVLTDRLHVGAVIPVGRHGWSLKHRKVIQQKR